MLSFKTGAPIAKIIGGEYNGKVIRVSMNLSKPAIKIDDIFDVIKTDMLTFAKRRVDPIDIDIIKEAVREGKEPRERHLKPIYAQVKAALKECEGKEFHINSGEMSQVPNTELERECLYIAGPSGSGKSTYVNKYVKQYLRTYPGNEVYIFSRVADDKTLRDNDEIKRIPIDENLVDDPIDNSELEDSIAIFDDIDTIREKPLREAVSSLRNDLLETGRHHKVTLLCTSHLLMDRDKTRTLLNEATSVTFFPNSGQAYHVKRFLKEYCGLDKHQIDRVLRLPSRWVTIGKTAPMYILYDKGCYLI
jgi:energy-coupling factor transporter ATP-binding protein EcfA2